MTVSQLSAISIIWGTYKLKLAMILSAEYGIFMPKANSGLQQHMHQEQSILRQISNVEH